MVGAGDFDELRRRPYLIEGALELHRRNYAVALAHDEELGAFVPADQAALGRRYGRRHERQAARGFVVSQPFEDHRGAEGVPNEGQRLSTFSADLRSSCSPTPLLNSPSLSPTPLKLNLKDTIPWSSAARQIATTTGLSMSPPSMGWGWHTRSAGKGSGRSWGVVRTPSSERPLVLKPMAVCRIGTCAAAKRGLRPCHSRRRCSF